MFEYRRIEDLQQVSELASSAFVIRHPDRPALDEWIERSIEHGRELFGVYEGESLLSQYMLYDYRMHLRGSVVPMGGIGLLCSRLDARGKGAVRTMIRESLGTMREAGHVVSVLNPFDATFYRNYGWELFARMQRLEMTPGLLEVSEDDGIAHEVVDLPTPDDASRRYYNECAAARLSLVQRGDAEWEARTRIFSSNTTVASRGVVRITRAGSVVGLIGYSLSGKVDEWHPTMTVNLLLYEDGPAKREALRYLKRLSHQIKTLVIELPVDEDLWPYFSDRPAKREILDQYMIRVVSVEGLDGLRFDTPDLSVAIELTDEQASWNAGSWSLTVDSGILRVERSDRADLRCGIGSLSSVVAGFTDFAELVHAGRAEPLPSYAAQDLPRASTFLADYF